MVHVLAVMLVIMAAVSVVAMDAEASEPTPSYTKYYGHTLQFVFSGSDAQSILWDFGDGNTSTEWNPQHTYAELGRYVVTQTVTNPLGNDTIIRYIEIMGLPTISFVGAEIEPISVSYNTVATAPDEPVREGYNFTGWFSDEGCSVAFDWSAPLLQHATVYVGWQEFGTAPEEPGDDEDGLDGSVIGYALIAIGLIIALAFMLTGRMPFGIVGLIIAGIGLAISAGIVSVPVEIMDLLEGLLP